MVGEDEVLTAAVEVDGLAQMGAAHGAALDVPARAAHAVGAFPCGLTGLCSLPDGKVGGILLQIVLHTAAQLAVAALQIVQLEVAQLAVLRVALDAEVDIPVLGNIGVSGIDQVLDDVQDLLDVLRCTGLDGGLFAVQTGGILEVLGLKALGHFLHGGALLLALLDELVIDIGDVGDIDDLVAAVFQIAAQGIEHDQRAGVADVDIVVNGGAADVDAVFAGHLRHKLFLLAGQGVENLHKNSPSCRANKSRSRTSQSRFADLRKQRSKKAPDVIQSPISHRRRFSKSRFHFCLSLKADNGGCRAAILPSRFPAACCPGALHTRCCKQAPNQRPVLSVQLTFALLCPGKRIFPDTSVL